MLGPDLGVQGGISSVESLIIRHRIDGVRVRHLATFGTESKLRRVGWYVEALPRALRIWSSATDVVHVHFSSQGSTARKLPLVMLALIAGKPVILHAHSGRFDRFFRGLPKWARRGIAAVFRRATAMVVLSESWRDFYVSAFGLKDGQCRILPNPVELPPAFPDRSARSHVTFLSLGRMWEQKGTFDTLTAVAGLKPHALPLKLILAGDGAVQEVRRRAQALGIGDQVEVLGWVGPTERARLLARADVFILPSYQEGLPMALLEAMAAGLPAIVTPVGGIPEVVRHEQEGLLVEPGDVPAIARAIRRLCEQPADRLAMGRAARRRVEPMAIGPYMQQLSELYRDVAERRR